MNHNKLLDIAAFAPKSLQSPNAWVGHLPFAAWLISEVKPKIFVELGTHTGNSYFSFCQSVFEASILTKCFAVDTWQGDEHAGQYSDAVFESVNTYNNERYALFSKLLRMTFDDALASFADQSIELLHIDGLHTYEAVKHDFESWLPKLAPGAVVVFHDTNVRERNFGVWKLWEELQLIYPNNLEFTHSYGLGVLQLNNSTAGNNLKWLQSGAHEKEMLLNYFEALGSRQMERFEFNELNQLRKLNQLREVNELKEIVESYKHKVAELDLQIIDIKQANIERENYIHQMFNSTSWRLTEPLRAVKLFFTQKDEFKDFKNNLNKPNDINTDKKRS